VTSFDLLIRGGIVIDGTGAPGRPAEVGVLGDRILAIGDLAGVDDGNVETAIDVADVATGPRVTDQP
jgi:N-acyl-D-amino-acid deacylase